MSDRETIYSLYLQLLHLNFLMKSTDRVTPLTHKIEKQISSNNETYGNT